MPDSNPGGGGQKAGGKLSGVLRMSYIIWDSNFKKEIFQQDVHYFPL